MIVNGPSRFLGFLNNDDLTRESLTDWGGYRTGDLGMLDEDGHFIYVGRSKDIIRRGGVTIVPAEVEPVILRHPAVHEVAIVPLPDDRLGERACAAIIARDGHAAPTLTELQEFLDAEGVAKYTWPESVEVFERVPAHAVAEGRQARRRSSGSSSARPSRPDPRTRAWPPWPGRPAALRRSARASCRSSGR